MIIVIILFQKNWGEFPEGFNVIDFLREITKELDFKRVLDFGCGYGRLSKAFDSDKYIGVDLNLKALKVQGIIILNTDMKIYL